MNDAKGQRQAEGSQHGCAYVQRAQQDKAGAELNRQGTFFATKTFVVMKAFGIKGPRSAQIFGVQVEKSRQSFLLLTLYQDESEPHLLKYFLLLHCT